MLGSQQSFGVSIGALVFLYLVAFIYTIIDLKNDPSNLDSAISLAFGIALMIIMNVAIISGCLLANNNPSTSSGIVGYNLHPASISHSASTVPVMQVSKAGFTIKKMMVIEQTSMQDLMQPIEEQKASFLRRALLDPRGMLLGWSNAYHTKFQPVWMWDRGSNKMNWIKATNGWTMDDKMFKDSIKFTTWGWFLKIYLPTLILVSLPPLAGAFVAYKTPPVGLGCWSLSFVVYAVCQMALAFLAAIKNSLDSERVLSKGSAGIFDGWKFWAWSSPLLLGSFFAIIGGTIMQVQGELYNCASYIPLHYWTIDYAPAIFLASDTQKDQDPIRTRLLVGIVAAGFMAFTCYVGWWYQRFIRKQFILTVEDIYRHGDAEKIIEVKTIAKCSSDEHSADGPLPHVMGDGAPAEENDVQDSLSDDSTSPTTMAPISALSNSNIMKEHSSGDLGTHIALGDRAPVGKEDGDEDQDSLSDNLASSTTIAPISTLTSSMKESSNGKF